MHTELQIERGAGEAEKQQRVKHTGSRETDPLQLEKKAPPPSLYTKDRMARNGPQGQQPGTASGGSGLMLCGPLPYLPLSGHVVPAITGHAGLLYFHSDSWISNPNLGS